MLHNVGGSSNTAIGRDTLFANITGNNNTAIGRSALGGNNGDANTAVGFGALASNTSGAFNTAIGANALVNSTSGSNNIALGIGAGSNVVTASDTICIGIAGVDVTDGCYIGHVFEEGIDPDNFIMGIDVNGKVGTHAVSSGMRLTDLLKDHEKVAQLEASVVALTTQLKEQAAQIQKVSAQVQMTNPTTKLVLNNQ
jgi:hypothetical protein